MISRREVLIGAANGAILAAGWRGALAQGPLLTKPARIVLGFPPGGSLDTITRQLARHLEGSYAPSVIVENRAGAGGRIGMDVVKSAEPDGTVMTIIPASLMVIYPHVYRKLTYDPFKDFAPVSTVCTFQFGFSVGPAVPENVKTVSHFAQWCKANPAQASFGSPAAGTIAHFAGVMVGRAANIDLTHVPYKGGAPAIQDVAGGQIPASINVLSEPLPFAKEGKIRILATTGSRRSAHLPDVPTMQEAGFDGFDIEEYFAAFVPARTPATVVNGLAAQIRSAVTRPDLQEAFSSRTFQASAVSAGTLNKMIRNDFEKWAPIVKSTGFSIDS